MPILSNLDVANRFFYLRKTCYRGMIRYNKEGKFNIPFGYYKKIDYSCLLNNKYFKLLQSTKILNQDFKKIFETYDSTENFMFLDPPYDSVFNSYSGSKFKQLEHKTLFNCFKKTKNKCLLTIGKTDFTKELYKDYICSEYTVNYAIKIHSNRIKHNSITKHLLIKNY